MKKFLSLLVTSVVAFGVLTGCGSQKDASTVRPSSVTFAVTGLTSV